MQVHNQETQPKLHGEELQKISRNKMKFNWRANWEILLVLVIIVVGIVITTIAAIRNKGEQKSLPIRRATNNIVLEKLLSAC